MNKLWLAPLLLLGACASQEEIAAKNAKEDHAFCYSVWGESQPGYGNCRMLKANERYQSGQRAASAAAGLGGAMLLQNQQQNNVPQSHPVTCYQQGYYTHCN